MMYGKLKFTPYLPYQVETQYLKKKTNQTNKQT